MIRGRQLGALILLCIGALAAQYYGPINATPPTEFLPKNPDHEYSFARLVYYSEGLRYGWPFGWTTDYPKADFQFMMGVKRLSKVDAHDAPVTRKIYDRRFFQCPFRYPVQTT